MSTASGYRLSPQQARLWSLRATSPAAAFRARCDLLLEGELDEEALERALSDLVERYEILRTRYRPLPGTLAAVQVPEAGPRALSFGRIDGTHLVSEEELVPRLTALLAEQVGRDVAPAEVPRLTLIPLGPQRHVLHIELPALSADRHSLLRLARLVGEAYAARRQGQAAPEASVQYADVSEVFNDLLESPDTEAGRRHWSERMGALVLKGPLRGEQPAAETADFVPRSLELPIAAETVRRLEAAAHMAKTSLPALVLTAWYALLHRLSGEPTCTVAVAHDGRTYEGLDEALGLFARYLPLQLEIQGQRSLLELAADVGKALAETVEWQDYFDLGRALSARGEAAPEDVPYVPVAFEASPWPAPCDAGGLRITLLALDSATERFDLKLACVENAGALAVHFHYDGSRYTDTEIARLAERFECLVQGAAAEPGRAIATLPLIGTEELGLLASWNQTARDWSTDHCIHELFDEQARRTPDRPAVVFGEQRLSYAELAGRANQLAYHLQKRGVEPETRVGLCLERSVDLVVGILGILKAGGAYVPLDPMAPRERLEHVMTEAQIRIVVTQEALRSLVPEAQAEVVSLDGDAGRIAEAPTTTPTRRVRPEHLAYVIFTSGSTGKPKGVMIEHRSAINLAAALREGIYRWLGRWQGRWQGRWPGQGQGQAPGRDAGLRVSLNAPVAFDASVKQWLQLLDGHTLYVVPEEVRPDAGKLCAFVEAHAIEVLDCTPSLLTPLVAQGLGRDKARSPVAVLVGGEAIDARTWDELAALPATSFINVYGPTECTVDATCCVVGVAPVPSLGRPLGNVRIHLLDSRLDPVPIGTVGEIYIGGAGVGRGYLGRPALTAERFVPDPAGDAPGGRLYRTGDLGRFRGDGHIEFLGRVDHQVKIRGYRIELGEIEAVLEEHPAVGQAVVMQREVAPGELHLVAYLVPREGAGGERKEPADLGGELRLWLRRVLPEYMVPWAFVSLAAWPLNANGKLDRAALPDPRVALPEEVPYEAPASQIERTVATVWQDVLKVERVGLHHNFFDLGGHSLLMVQVHERLSASLGQRLSMVELFRHPTVAALARYIAGLAEEPRGDTGLDERAARQRRALAEQAQRTKARRGRGY